MTFNMYTIQHAVCIISDTRDDGSRNLRVSAKQNKAHGLAFINWATIAGLAADQVLRRVVHAALATIL